MNILLAEDTTDLADLMLLLIKSTYEVKVVWKPDGLEALEEFKSCSELDGDSYNFVITDRNMPKMSGLELAKNLNTIDPEMPVILWTSDYHIPPQTTHLFKEVVPKSKTMSWIGLGLKEYLD